MVCHPLSSTFSVKKETVNDIQCHALPGHPRYFICIFKCIHIKPTSLLRLIITSPIYTFYSLKVIFTILVTPILWLHTLMKIRW